MNTKDNQTSLVDLAGHEFVPLIQAWLTKNSLAFEGFEQDGRHSFGYELKTPEGLGVRASVFVTEAGPGLPFYKVEVSLLRLPREIKPPLAEWLLAWNYRHPYPTRLALRESPREIVLHMQGPCSGVSPKFFEFLLEHILEVAVQTTDSLLVGFHELHRN
jgi:hypothetical protein